MMTPAAAGRLHALQARAFLAGNGWVRAVQRLVRKAAAGGYTARHNSSPSGTSYSRLHAAVTKRFEATN